SAMKAIRQDFLRRRVPYCSWRLTWRAMTIPARLVLQWRLECCRRATMGEATWFLAIFTWKPSSRSKPMPWSGACAFGFPRRTPAAPAEAAAWQPASRILKYQLRLAPVLLVFKALLRVCLLQLATD